jgi:hypothetical protein
MSCCRVSISRSVGYHQLGELPIGIQQGQRRALDRDGTPLRQVGHPNPPLLQRLVERSAGRHADIASKEHPTAPTAVCPSGHDRPAPAGSPPEG